MNNLDELEEVKAEAKRIVEKYIAEWKDGCCPNLSGDCNNLKGDCNNLKGDYFFEKEVVDNFGISDEEADWIYCELEDFNFEIYEEGDLIWTN